MRERVASDWRSSEREDNVCPSSDQATDDPVERDRRLCRYAARAAMGRGPLTGRKLRVPLVSEKQRGCTQGEYDTDRSAVRHLYIDLVSDVGVDLGLAQPDGTLLLPMVRAWAKEVNPYPDLVERFVALAVRIVERQLVEHDNDRPPVVVLRGLVPAILYCCVVIRLRAMGLRVMVEDGRTGLVEVRLDEG